jgi:hypothetical protein
VTLAFRRVMRQCWTVAARATTASGGAPSAQLGSLARHPKMKLLLTVRVKAAEGRAAKDRDTTAVATLEVVRMRAR